MYDYLSVLLKMYVDDKIELTRWKEESFSPAVLHIKKGKSGFKPRTGKAFSNKDLIFEY